MNIAISLLLDRLEYEQDGLKYCNEFLRKNKNNYLFLKIKKEKIQSIKDITNEINILIK